MSAVADAVSRIEKAMGRIETVERRVLEIGKTSDATGELVRKAFLGAPPGQRRATLGYDGANTADLLQYVGGGRSKSLGREFGGFLKACYVAAGGNPAVAEWDGGPVEKYFDRAGSKAVQKTALAEGSGQTGGYTVPVQFYADLLRYVAEESFVRQKCTVLPMQSRSMLVPALLQTTAPAAGTSAFFGGIAASWQPEAATINESEPKFHQIELVARDLVFTTVASNQLLQDNAVALDTLLTTLFKEAMGWFVDYYILQGGGVGANQPLGILNAPATYLQAGGASSTFALVDAANMLARLLLSGWKHAMWIMHPSVIPQLIQMTNGATNSPFLVWLNPTPNSGEGGPAAQALPAQLFGIPIYFTEKVPALGTQGCVLLCDMSKYLVGDRLALQIEVSPHVKFLTNQMVWRIICRWDGQPWLEAPIILGDGVYKMSSFVQLKEAS